MHAFENTAKNSWQSYSIMRKFMIESDRLENASWRLWYVQRHANEQQLNNVLECTLDMKHLYEIEVTDGNGAPKYGSRIDAPTLFAVCVYCELKMAILSCNGCCHDTYCLDCFKFIHKKGSLATHTAISIAKKRSSSPSQAISSKHVVKVNCSLNDRLQSSGKYTSYSRNRQYNSAAKAWELRMDVLLQKLMKDSLSHEGIISAKDFSEENNINGCSYCINDFDILKSEFTSEVDVTHNVDGYNIADTEVAYKYETRQRADKRDANCAHCGGGHFFIDCPILNMGSGTAISAPTRAKDEPVVSRGMSDRNTVETSVRKYFTTVHNDNCANSTHAFLGDEMSVHGPVTLDPANVLRHHRGHDPTWKQTVNYRYKEPQSSLYSITEDDAVYRTILIPLSQGMSSTHNWLPNLWLVPGLLYNAPQDVYIVLQEIAQKNLCHSAQLRCRVKMQRQGLNSPWRDCIVYLHRNFLWEFALDQTNARPTGFINISDSTCRYVKMDATFTLQVRFSPLPSDQDTTKLAVLMQFNTEHEMIFWKEAIKKASRLTISDLFEESRSSTELSSDLGSGRFSVVRKYRRKVDAGSEHKAQDCALKIIDKDAFWKLVEVKIERPDTLIREIVTQTTLTVRAEGRYCPVIRLLSIFETKKQLVLELDLMRNGDLHEEIVRNSVIDEHRTSYLVASLVKGIQYCQANRIAHRDIKLSNLAFDHCKSKRDGSRYSILKLADFGMAAFMNIDGNLNGRCGTPGFVAPEILLAGKGDSYSGLVDMFSTGVVMYTMLCGYEPFFGVTDDELIQANKSVQYNFDEPEWHCISSQAKELIMWMMHKDPTMRVDPEKALSHPFLCFANRKLDEVLRSRTKESTMGIF